MAFDPIIAETRFGVGLSPRHTPVSDVDAMMARIAGPDHMAQRFVIAGFSDARPSVQDLARASRARTRARGSDQQEATLQALRDLRQQATQTMLGNALRIVARGVATQDGLRERLVAFWADHFTVRSRSSQHLHLVSAFTEDAIRPHVTGHFGTMLRAVVTHPVMLAYLQQWDSHGPNSILGQRRGKGLNENLAREMLELHTLGVSGAYDQSDVRQLAEALTGLTFDQERDFKFEPRMAEPGGETILGRDYGAAAGLDRVFAVLDDLAVHPDTARHLATKLASHFVADTPPAALVDALAQRYLETEGDLGALVETLLRHPAAWEPTRQKVRRPLEYVIAALRALDVQTDTLLAMDRRAVRRWLQLPLRVMGQPWEAPPGPDGWPEAAQDWIIPQTMAGRISWAMQAPGNFRRDLPDPRVFVETALGPNPPADVAFAASAAEMRRDGIGVVLASPAFQRR